MFADRHRRGLLHDLERRLLQTTIVFVSTRPAGNIVDSVGDDAIDLNANGFCVQWLCGANNFKVWLYFKLLWWGGGSLNLSGDKPSHTLTERRNY